jgi:hypothetical protein
MAVENPKRAPSRKFMVVNFRPRGLKKALGRAAKAESLLARRSLR